MSMNYKVLLVVVLFAAATPLATPTNAQDTPRKEKTYKRSYYKDRKTTDIDTTETMRMKRRAVRRTIKEKRNH